MLTALHKLRYYINMLIVVLANPFRESVLKDYVKLDINKDLS